MVSNYPYTVKRLTKQLLNMIYEKPKTKRRRHGVGTLGK